MGIKYEMKEVKEPSCCRALDVRRFNRESDDSKKHKICCFKPFLQFNYQFIIIRHIYYLQMKVANKKTINRLLNRERHFVQGHEVPLFCYVKHKLCATDSVPR